MFGLHPASSPEQAVEKTLVVPSGLLHMSYSKNIILALSYRTPDIGEAQYPPVANGRLNDGGPSCEPELPLEPNGLE